MQMKFKDLQKIIQIQFNNAEQIKLFGKMKNKPPFFGFGT